MDIDTFTVSWNLYIYIYYDYEKMKREKNDDKESLIQIYTFTQRKQVANKDFHGVFNSHANDVTKRNKLK